MTTNVVFHNATRDSGFAVIDGVTMVSEAIAEDGTNRRSAAATRPFVTITSTAAIYIAIGGLLPDATVATALRR